METDKKHKALRQFLQALPNAQLYPYGKTSGAKTGEAIKEKTGDAAAPNGNPETVLAAIAREARAVESAE